MSYTKPVPGTRTIRRNPDAPHSHRWEGEIDNTDYLKRYWKADTPERVERQMNQTLGEVPTAEYQIEEKRDAPQA